MLQYLISISEPIRKLFLRFIRPILKTNYINNLDISEEVVLLVCNGPSLNKVDLNAFRSIKGYGLNKIHLIFPRTKWRPRGIFVINGLVLRQLKNTINRCKAIPYYGDEKAFFLGVKPAKYMRFDAKRIGEPQSLFKSASVTVAALQILVRSKPKRIIIVGLDHNFVVKKNLKSNGIEKFQGDDMNHFSKEYFKNQLWGAPDLAKENYQLREIKAFAEELNVEILDATINGKLDVFEKINIDLAYDMAKVK